MAATAQKKSGRKPSQTAQKTERKKTEKNTGQKTVSKNGTRTAAKKGSGAQKKKTAKTSKQQRQRENVPSQEKNTQVREEILLWLVLAISVFALISSFGMGGFVGERIGTVLFGIFGTLGYAIPFLFFFCFAFFLSNKRNKIVWVKILAILLLIVVLCGFFELIPNGYLPSRKLGDYYENSAFAKSGGGVIGGAISSICCPALGVVGTYVILFILSVISFVLLTEKSLFAGIEKGSRKVYDSAREESAYQREAWERRRIQHRLEREERRNQNAAYWEETHARSHSVANIVIRDTQSAQEQPKEEELEEDWLEEEAEKDKEQRRQQKAMPYEQQEEEALQRETAAQDGENRQKNFWERIEEEPKEETPMDVEIEEIDLMEEEHADKEKNIEGIFVPQCRMTEMEQRERTYRTEKEEEQEEVRSLQEETARERKIPLEDEQEEEIPKWEYGESKQVQETQKALDRQTPHRRSMQPDGAEEIAEIKEKLEEETEVKKEYEFPPMDLLNLQKSDKKSENMQELKETAIKLQQTLNSFGVHVNVIDASCGPAVTRYELQPEQGVKVSRIVNLADDIKLNLAAADIRIEAPIPGKAAVGIEVPNKETSTVYLRELLESRAFQSHPSSLAFAAGKDIAGNVIVTDIAKMPHLLIAGATGSGKSVCINTIVISLLYKARPEEVKLIMIDPKVVELSVYNGIPHLMIPVVTDPKKAAGALNWAVGEMTERYNKFAVMGVRDLKGYNQKVASIENIEGEEKPEKMPQIVIIVDELADLMMVAQNDVEDAICRLAQLARAAGIHLIIATQRPSVNVITGVIKANMPSRIAFSVSSGVDSRTILDMNGAEKLLGKGDMLFFPQGLPKPVRVQGAFVSDTEVSDVVEFLKAQNLSSYKKEVEEKIKTSQAGQSGQDGNSQWDPYFEQAGKIVIDKEKASIGMLQRGLKVGFNRAARIMEQLCEAGVVGEEEGTKPRKVLMSLEEFEEYVEESV